MKKGVICLFLLGVLLISNLALAQEQVYSGFDRIIDNTKLTFSGADNKVRLALDIREKEVNSAINNIQNQEEDKAIKNLERAKEKLQIVQEKVSLDTSNEIKENVQELIDKINMEEGTSDEFEEYILEEEKTQLTAELTEKNYEYCKELAKQDYSLMLKQEKCNPETAPENLQKKLKELKQIQEESFIELMLDIRSCIDDLGTCNCEDNTDITQKAKCEKMVALAIKCEYKDDKNSCSELESMKPTPNDGFAESFVPDFLMNLFKKKEYMIEYNIKKSDVPPECYNENERVKTQCAAFRDMKELSSKCWDKEGNFLVDECGGPKEDTPTMQESIPQCYDEENNFLEEECGKITIIWKDGLINYIIETEVENIIDEFENKSEQHTIDINGIEGQTLINDIKEEMDGIEGQIAERTFAQGTYDTGEVKNDIKTHVIEEGKDVQGDDGLKREVKTDIAGNGGGDDGLKREVKTDIAGDGTDEEPLPVPNLNLINPDLYDPNAGSPRDSIDDTGFIDDTYDDEIINGDNNIDDGDIIEDSPDNVIDEPADNVDDTSSSDTGSDDVGGVDEGPGEPGVVDED